VLLGGYFTVPPYALLLQLKIDF